MSDLIDRNDAVEAIEFEKVYMTAYKGNSNGYVSEGNPLKQYNKGLDDAIKAINSLAPAEPEPKWIPVSEALPEDNRQVLVYAQSTHFALAKYDEMREADGKYRKQWVTFDAWKPFYTIENVLAWMPLSEPWRGE